MTLRIEQKISAHAIEESQLTVDMRQGIQAAEYMRKILDERAPTVSRVRTFRPPDECFIDLQAAMRRDNPHSIGHVGRAIIIGLSTIPLLGFSVEETKIVTALRFHDCRLSSWDNYPDHGLHAAQWLEERGWHTAMGGLWDDIRFLLVHHSDRIGTNHHGSAWGSLDGMLSAMQDIDAAELTRPGVNIPFADIQLRTAGAVQYDLPHVAFALQKTASVIDTGDLFEDQIAAGIHLKLVRPDTMG